MDDAAVASGQGLLTRTEDEGDATHPAKEQRVMRWEDEAVLDAMQERLDRAPKTMRIWRQTAEHPFGTIKARTGATPLPPAHP